MAGVQGQAERQAPQLEGAGGLRRHRSSSAAAAALRSPGLQPVKDAPKEVPPPVPWPGLWSPWTLRMPGPSAIASLPGAGTHRRDPRAPCPCTCGARTHSAPRGLRSHRVPEPWRLSPGCRGDGPQDWHQARLADWHRPLSRVAEPEARLRGHRLPLLSPEAGEVGQKHPSKAEPRAAPTHAPLLGGDRPCRA